MGLDLQDLDLLDAECLGGAVDEGIAAGIRDENDLTDKEFYARHPERIILRDPRIQKDEKALIKEWLHIRDTVVRPALAKMGVAPRSSGASGPSGGDAPSVLPGSNADVAEREAATTKRNQFIAAGVLGGLAVTGIIVAATR